MAHFIEIPSAVIENWLRDKRFTRMAVSGERTFERPSRVCPSLRLVVWTSVPEDGGTTRALGKDAIRVALVAVVGVRRWPLHKCKRIHRTTSVDSVLDRIKDRLLEGAEAAKAYGKPCPRCFAPTYGDSGRCIVRECRENTQVLDRVLGRATGADVAPAVPCGRCGAATYADSGRCTVRSCRESAVIPTR